MAVSKLLLFLNPWVNQFKEHLPRHTIHNFPFYQSVSRLKNVVDPFDNKLISKPVAQIISLPDHGMSFGDIADQRALELENRNVPVYVMWSGGIDSTVILTSIFKNWKPQNLQRLTVLCTTDSIRENPNFFKLIASKSINLETTSLYLEQYLRKGIVVTGECGDQLFGSDNVGHCVNNFGEDVIHQDWKKIVPKYFETMPNGAEGYEHYQSIVNESPFTLKTVQDFFWWFNFTQKWQHVQLRLFAVSGTWNNPKETFPNVVHFYDHEPFQVWSLHNHHLKIKNEWNSYKFTAKEYVVNYTKDDTFLKKIKEISLPNLYMGHEFNWAIDEHWNFLSKEEALKRIKHE